MVMAIEPLSRCLEPKQFLALPSDITLLEQTVRRVAAYGINHKPILVCGAEHAALVEAHMKRAGIDARLVLEPGRRNTAAAIAAVAEILLAEDPDAQMLVTPADHFISDPTPLARTLSVASELVAKGGIVTFGITPRGPSTSYGYIEMGEAATPPARRVKRFVEKPSRDVAEKFLRSGGFTWNSGIFLFRADTFLSELKTFEPSIARAIAKSAREAVVSGAQIRLGAEAFLSSPDKSIDYAVMERTQKAFVVPVELSWSDLGTWDAIWEVLDKDKAGNVLQGDVVALDSHNSLFRSGGRLVAAVGVENLVVIDTQDAVMVAPRERAHEVKAVVDELRRKGRVEADTPAIVERPWGTYQTLFETPGYKVKRIRIYPGAAISLQFHNQREEHWTITSGTGVFTLDADEQKVVRGNTVHIPVRAHHRLRNDGAEVLEFIEVQLGPYLGEDDIVRITDDYGRA